jgi:hypothetical protein
LIDEEPNGLVCIRIYPNRTAGHRAAWLFLSMGATALLFVFVRMHLSAVAVLRSAPMLFAASLLFVLAAVMRFGARRSRTAEALTTIVASAHGVEYSSNGFDARMIPGEQIQRVFLTSRTFVGFSTGLRMTDDSKIVLCAGTKAEMESVALALDRAIHPPQ